MTISSSYIGPVNKRIIEMTVSFFSKIQIIRG